jgi:hypothetical protein
MAIENREFTENDLLGLNRTSEMAKAKTPWGHSYVVGIAVGIVGYF